MSSSQDKRISPPFVLKVMKEVRFTPEVKQKGLWLCIYRKMKKKDHPRKMVCQEGIGRKMILDYRYD